ncbi:MAG TPA: ABC transporter substrate-binding protein [Candidatus Paceibacterota bacterium]|jgi:ABC-type transport system substrate-binding protein|nr:ABC transporter substrate-binding protein [Candidatus Paceibacterota bacterium]
MASFTSFLKSKKFPAPRVFRALLRGPLTAFRVVVYGMIIALCAVAFVTLIVLNNNTLVTVPARGGNLTEGVIGAPHSINPISANTETDTRLVSLVYATLEDDMQSYTVSPDGSMYTVTLLPNLRFSDKKPLTSDDIAFTVQKMQNSSLSSQSAYWQNISTDTPDPNTVVFTLPHADTSFLSRLNFGILPKHIWQTVSDEQFDTAPQNLRPIGNGAFKISDIDYQNGIPSTIILTRNTINTGPSPFLRTLTLSTYANQSSLLAALNNGDVDFSYDASPEALKDTAIDAALTVQHIPSDQTVSIYRSPSDAALASGSTVLQLNQLIDKNAIIAIVRNGYGTPAGALASTTQNISTKAPSTGFALAVENDPELLLAAQTLAQQLQSHGITVLVKAYDPGVFQNNVTAGTFTLFLARNGDVNIPQQYSTVIPLYTESVPYIFDTSTHTIIPTTLESPVTEYSDVKDWYANTDKLWKWFIRKK